MQEDVLSLGIECCIERSPTATRRTLGMIAVSVLLLSVLTSPAGRRRRHKKTSAYSADNTETSIEQHVFAVVDDLLPLQIMCFSRRLISTARTKRSIDDGTGEAQAGALALCVQMSKMTTQRLSERQPTRIQVRSLRGSGKAHRSLQTNVSFTQDTPV